MLLIKVGGGASINLAGIADDVATLGEPAIIVHGANAIRNQLAERLGIEIQTVKSVSGTSSVYTDDEVVELMMMAYAGLANKRLVELLQQRGVNAVGLSGLDGRIVSARRNPGIRVRRGSKKILLRDRSGRAEAVNAGLLRLLLKGGYTPVLTMPLCDQNGVAVNSENDDVVAAIQRSLPADRIVFLIEAAGILTDADDSSSALDHLSRSELESNAAVAAGRMGRKLRAILKILDSSLVPITISDGRTEHPLVDALEGIGTVIE